MEMRVVVLNSDFEIETHRRVEKPRTLMRILKHYLPRDCVILIRSCKKKPRAEILNNMIAERMSR